MADVVIAVARGTRKGASRFHPELVRTAAEVFHGTHVAIAAYKGTISPTFRYSDGSHVVDAVAVDADCARTGIIPVDRDGIILELLVVTRVTTRCRYRFAWNRYGLSGFVTSFTPDEFVHASKKGGVFVGAEVLQGVSIVEDKEG